MKSQLTNREAYEAIFYPNGTEDFIRVVDELKLPYTRVKFEKYEDFRKYLFEDELYFQELLYDAYMEMLQEERFNALFDFNDSDIDIDSRIDKKHQKFFNISVEEDEVNVRFDFDKFLKLTENEKENRTNMVKEISCRLFGEDGSILYYADGREGNERFYYDFEYQEDFVHDYVYNEYHQIHHLDLSNLHQGVVEATIDEFCEETRLKINFCY